MPHLLVYMTAPNLDTARSLGRDAVHKRLASGVNILGGASSIYWWEEAVQERTEAVCLFTTTEDAWPELRELLTGSHPYVTPCIVALPIEKGAVSFLRWIEAETFRPTNSASTV